MGGYEGFRIQRESQAGSKRDQEDHINTRILHNSISDIPLLLGLGTRMSDPSVDVRHKEHGRYAARRCKTIAHLEPKQIHATHFRFTVEVPPQFLSVPGP